MADSRQSQAWRLHALRDVFGHRVLQLLALRDIAALAGTCRVLKQVARSCSAASYHAASRQSGVPLGHPIFQARTAQIAQQRIRQAFTVHAAIRDPTATPKPRQAPVLSS